MKEENKPDNLTVHADVKAIAWECLRREHKPQSANYEDVLRAIASPNEDDDDKKDKAKVRLKYLENRLRLIRIKEPGYKVLFDLDPLAEYLAGLYLVDCYGMDEQKWSEFLAEADSKLGAPEAIKGFLLAVRDCYLAKVPEAQMTDFVSEELGRRSGLDPNTVKQAQFKQRIQYLISTLSLPNAKDRIYAVQELVKIGSAIKDAISASPQSYEDKQVCIGAIWVLEQIDSKANEVIPALIKLLKDEDKDVRRNAASAVVVIGSEAKDAIPVLTELLKDESNYVRFSAALALGEISLETTITVPALIEAFKDEDELVHVVTVRSLWKIGLPAIDALIKALKNDDKRVRKGAAKALGKISSADREVVTALMKACNDPDDKVREAAEEAIKKILGEET